MNKLIDIFYKSSSFDHKDDFLVKEKGVVFTNKEICDKIINNLSPNINDKICEPSVGKGSFIFSLLEYFRKEYNIEEIVYFVENKLFCFDINYEFIKEFKKLLREYFILFGINDINLENIKCEDYLLNNDTYDITLGNPPYVRIQNLDKEYLSKLKKNYNSVKLGNIDLYYAFVEKALLTSKKIGFIIPNAFIKNKSGKFLRELIKSRVNYIYNFEHIKVWDKISAYTSIIICSEESHNLTYETKNSTINKNKEELGEDNWIFQDLESKNILYNEINSYMTSLATIRDDVYKMDYCDDKFCYKNNFRIEKDICVKYIKATTNFKFEDYKWIIYPYDDSNQIINEEDIKLKFPNCYEYFIFRKDELVSRDKGKIEKYDSWYSYGRRQGLLKEIKYKGIIIPLTFLKSRKPHIIEIPNGEKCLVMSGFILDVENFDKVKTILKSDDFIKYCEASNKILAGRKNSTDVWLSINAKTLKEY